MSSQSAAALDSLLLKYNPGIMRCCKGWICTHPQLPQGLRWWRICLQCRRPGFDPWVRKIPWMRAWQPAPVFLPGEFHGQRSLVGYSPWDHMSRTWLNDFTVPSKPFKAPKCLFSEIILVRPTPKQPTKAADEPWPYLPCIPLCLPPLCPSQTVFTLSRLRSSAGPLQAQRAHNPQPHATELFVRESFPLCFANSCTRALLKCPLCW